MLIHQQELWKDYHQNNVKIENMEIYVNNEKVDMENISITNFNEQIEILKYNFSQTEFDFSSIHYLSGDKTLLEQSFQHQKKESLE